MRVIALGFAALPLILTAGYVFVWPSVAVGRLAVIVVGVSVGLVICLMALYWAAIPLQSVGIAGQSSGSPAGSLQGVIGLRLATAAVAAAIVVVGVLLASSRLFGRA